jgi:lipoate-protein ligase A
MATGSGSRSSVDDASLTPFSRTINNWRFSFDGPATGAENMARDWELFQEMEADPTLPPVFRLYTWNPPCISLGHHQAIEDELDMDAVRRFGFDVVKRPTGGRAILHDEELTYSVVAAIDDPRVGGSLRESHETISRIFQDALTGLGVAARMAAPTDYPDRLVRGRASAPCFSATTRTELVLEGRKLLGSAQRRGSRAFLQHGSLLLGAGHVRLADCLNLSQEERRELQARLRSGTPAPGRVGVAEIVAALRESIRTWV